MLISIPVLILLFGMDTKQMLQFLIFIVCEMVLIFGYYFINKKSKNTSVRIGYILTMTVMGLWNGFQLHYILYGVYQGIMLLVTDVY